MDQSTWFPMDSRTPVEFIDYFALIARPVFLVVMDACCIITVTCLRRASPQRELMTGNMKEEVKGGDNLITQTLLFLCFVYIVLAFPETCSAIIVTIVPEYFIFKKLHSTFIVTYQFIWMASFLP
ncbi:hypothetical protein ACOMHN_034617 [Nucella lapillus]